MSFGSLPSGWQVWSEEPSGRSILAFRPDVFNEEAFPAACLPTIYLTNGARTARPGSGQYETADWHVVLYLEPEIEAVSETYDDRATAADAAVEVAARFADGEIDYRELYQVPREEYFDGLDDLTGT